ncbi:MAG: chemotaxis protein CheW [Desulfomonilaceae bacterium]
MIDTQILQDYCNEARELLEEMDSNLLLIEREGAKPELLNNIFREVHCIKGSAQYIGLERSSTLTHGLESLLDRLREGIIDFDAKITDFLFRAKDLVSALVNEVSEDHVEKSDILGLMQDLEAIVGRTGEYNPQTVTDVTDQNATPDGEIGQPVIVEGSESSTSPQSDADETSTAWQLNAVVEVIPEETSTASDTSQEDGAGNQEFFNQTAIEETASHLLNIALYFDDLQDGVRPSEILDPLIDLLGRIKESFSAMGMLEAHEVLASIEDRVNLIEPEKERLSTEEIDELRSLLNALRVYYPAELFPLSENGLISKNSDVAIESTSEISPFVRELSAVPGVDTAIAAAIEKAGFSSKERLRTANFSTLLKIPGISRSAVEALLQYAGALSDSSKLQSSQRKAQDISMLADVDDDLLREFEQVLDDAFAPAAGFNVDFASLQGGLATDLLEEVGAMGEDGDREIIEIFLGYGYEVLDKLQSIIPKIARHAANRNDMVLCADWIKSIRSSSGYMDYRKLEAFLDDWYEKVIWAADHLESLSEQDILLIQENLWKFQDFLHGVEKALNPEVHPEKTAFASAQNQFVGVTSEITQPISPTAAPLAMQPAAVTQVPILEELPTIVTQITTPAISDVSPADGPRQDISPPQKDQSAESTAFQELLMERDSHEKAVVKTMRVDSNKVDTLLNQVGELVVNRSYVERLSQNLKDFHRVLVSVGQIGKKEIQSARELATKVSEASVSLGRVANDIQEGVMKLRMLPVGQLFNRMPRLIRDLSRRVGKVVNLEVHGADTEVDKRVIEQIYNPLVHLVRNAVDHGIEDRETRKMLGKKEQGLLTLRAYSQGSQVIVDVEDDGRGINTALVLERAVASGLIDAQAAKSLSQYEIYNLLFLPGFSTSSIVTRTSGRGVGMDVVKKDVEKINGHVEIESWENKGTRVSIKIPLTLAIIQTLLIRTSNHVFAIPMAAVREIIRISPGDITSLEGFDVIKFRQETVPVVRMNEVFKLRNCEETNPKFLVLTTAGVSTLGLLVEELIGEQDVVIKPLGEHVFESRGLAGSTILGDGAIALVLDIPEIVEDVIAAHRQLAAQGSWQARTALFEEERTGNL